MPLRLVRFPKRSPHWYIRGSVRGQAVFETTRTHDKDAAEALRIKREAQLLQRSVFGPGATVTFLEAAVSYLDDGGEARFIQPLVDHFGTTPLCQIRQDETDAAAKRLLPNAGPATRKRHVYGPLCAVLNHAARKGWVNPPRIQHPTIPVPSTKWSTPERLEKLLPHCGPDLRRLVMLLTYTGARLSEALGVDWDRDVNLAQRTIILPKTKNGKMRALHIPDALLIELAAVPEKERHGQLFTAWSDKRHVHKPLRTACRRAGVEYLPPHQQGRHTYATWLRMFAGLDLKGIMEAGGWDSVQSVARYAHVSPGEAARAADKLPSVQNQCNSVVDHIKPRATKRKTV